MNQVKAFIERGKDGSFGVYVDLKDETLNYGIHGNGKTKEEAIEDFRSAYVAMKALYEKKGKNFVEAEFTYHTDVISYLEYYNQFITLKGLGKLTGINQAQLSHYLQGVRNPSPATIQKIQKSIQEFGKELQHLEFA